MRNYFSQLAKQSGLRVAAPGEKTRDVKTLPAPLDREETIITAADSPSAKASETPPKLPKASASFTQKSSKAAETKPENIKTTIEEMPADLKSGTGKLSSKASDFEFADQKLSEKSFSETPPAGLRVSEETFFVESGAPKLSELKKSGDSQDENTADSATEKSPDHQKYFQKTSEILEKGGDASQLEIQRILLQEVQQWAAETPEITDFAETEIVEAKQPTVKILQSPRAAEEIVFERENSVIRGSDDPRLEEQNLTLSIGSISIVIEDAEKPPPEIVPVERSNNESRSGENKRTFSSLRRNYL